MALYRAKAEGRGMHRFFEHEMDARLQARRLLELDIRKALAAGEFELQYQAQVNLETDRVTGFEALLRWRHSERGVVPPADFIPLAEETGLIEPLGEWVIGQVCRDLRAWLDAGLPVPPLAVNLSARQFRQHNLVDVIAQALARHEIDPAMLTLEMTESAVMHDIEAAVVTVKELKALGVRLSLDDFGTGYSSLSHLKRFPIDHLKIDASFVRDVTSDPDSAIICDSIVGLAHGLKMTVIAEGVETQGQMQYLRGRQCDEMQGYYFSRPVAGTDFAQLLGNGQRLNVSEAEPS